MVELSFKFSSLVNQQSRINHQFTLNSIVSSNRWYKEPIKWLSPMVWVIFFEPKLLFGLLQWHFAKILQNCSNDAKNIFFYLIPSWRFDWIIWGCNKQILITKPKQIKPYVQTNTPMALKGFAISHVNLREMAKLFFDLRNRRPLQVIFQVLMTLAWEKAYHLFSDSSCPG